MFVFTQQAREMVLEIVREKEQADFRGVRGDFSSRLAGGSIEVRSSPVQFWVTLLGVS